MAERSSFFDSVNRDRAYFAADYALHLSTYFTNGIFNNGLRVVANNNMTISVEAGDANINGYRYNNDSRKILNVSNADGVLNRIDNIVIRLDIPNRQIKAEIITGNFAQNPVAPPLVRNASVFDLRIATINVRAGTASITTNLITDTRLLSSDCGNVVSAVQSLNTDDIFAQYEATFNSWFGKMKNQLSEDAAGSLQLQLDGLKEDVRENSHNINGLDGQVKEINSGFRSFGITEIPPLETMVERDLVPPIHVANAGLYDIRANIPINHMGQAGREMRIRIRINETTVFLSTAVINTWAFTVAESISDLINIPANATVRITVQSSSMATWAVGHSGNVRKLRVR